MIEKAKHYVYIENQFLISNSTGRKGLPVENIIFNAIYKRIVRAHTEGTNIKFYMFTPLIPGFAGDVEKASLLKESIELQM